MTPDEKLKQLGELMEGNTVAIIDAVYDTMNWMAEAPEAVNPETGFKYMMTVARVLAGMRMSGEHITQIYEHIMKDAPPELARVVDRIFNDAKTKGEALRREEATNG